MSSFAISGSSDPRPAAYALARAASQDRAGQNAAVRQSRADEQQRVAEVAVAQQSSAVQERQAEAARQQAALVQATTGAVLNVYA
ncbi:hypothetical protein [Cryptosporangium aurantiacum]|uniref:Uncharacterized protein n=1 Tax=Cryptosporangium aurantiacum TaxID=134849 RepID=A0A1M7JII5_9ACTN|nr:hypothetical protein [Cryptosporangium aurantiacum]SHM52909.1 hypothetical protein SAMN05443668_101813 [Cryptosporangium aurantiacum]